MSGAQAVQGLGVTFTTQSVSGGSVTLHSDGSITGTGGVPADLKWILPVQTGIGTNFGLRLTKTSSIPGSVTFSPSVGSVWSLDVDRLIQAVGGIGFVSGTLEITSLDGTVVYSSASITVDNTV